MTRPPRWPRDHDGSLATARAALAEIMELRPDASQARVLSARAKLPFKAAFSRDSLLWRIVELGSAALRCYDEKEHVAGIILARALMESVAALKALHDKLTGYAGGGVDDLDRWLMQAALGWRSRDDRPQALNILTVIDRITRDGLSAFRSLYDQMSEFAHPNAEGTTNAFARIDSKGTIARFNRDGDDAPRRAWLLIEGIATSLMLVPPPHGAILADAFRFARMCEADLDGTA